MNLSVVERMVRDGDLSKDAATYLIGCRGECEWLDYKESLSLSNDKAVADFTRDVIALKNVGGGYIVVGVKDKTWECVGISEQLPFDTKLLRDQVRRCCGLDLEVDVVHHAIRNEGKDRLVAIIYVRSSKKRTKRRVPTVVQKDFQVSQKYGLRRGEIYARKGDSTVRVSSQSELEELLENMEEQSDRDALSASPLPSPFAIEDGTYRLLARGFDCFIGRQTIREQLLGAVLRDPRLWIINVHGPGGVGKSALVNWVTHELYKRREFEAIIQLTAKETILTANGIRPFGRSLYSLENLLAHILSLFLESTSDDLQSQKKIATDYLCAYRTLLVLDNMETVSDGRILGFIQGLPPDNRSKVLLTSRQKTGGWELPISVSEFSGYEVREFLAVKSDEVEITFPLDDETVDKVRDISGGLPLAIQWIIGQYKAERDVNRVLSRMRGKDSPVLEFSFRNVWERLGADARVILPVMTIFDGPPSAQQIVIATEFPIDRVERALAELADVTLVDRRIQESDGQVLYSALPITLSFARHQLEPMGEFELKCRQRLQRYTDQMKLQEVEIARFRSVFERHGITSDIERRAAILCRRAESDVFSGNTDNAEQLFKQARDLAPTSAYVLAMCASFELTRNQIGCAIERINEACKRATKQTGALCYTVMAQIRDAQHDRLGRIDALRRAIEFDMEDNVLRHQLGVALSRASFPQKAIEEFDKIIASESIRVPPRETLIMALNTRIINLRRLGRDKEAEDDLQRTQDIVREHPHLREAAQRVR